MSILKNLLNKVVSVAAAFSPTLGSIAAIFGIAAAPIVINSGSTIEEKLTAVAVALVTSAIHRLSVLAKDFLDNGKLDGSYKEPVVDAK